MTDQRRADLVDRIPVLSHTRRGSGRPLLLVHGLGSRGTSWGAFESPLGAARELILVDLPGHGLSEPVPGEPTVAALADALEALLDAQQLRGVDAAGSSLGARLVLELARRHAVGDVVALSPGGFWTPGEVKVFRTSLLASGALVRALQPVASALTANPVTRTALLAQFVARPWALDGQVAADLLDDLAGTVAFDDTLKALADGPTQDGIAAGAAPGRITIGWGRRDRVTLARQAARAVERFPDAELRWFERCGHLPHLEHPEETADLVLAGTGS